ncbi:hypothetical protein [Mycobacterium sp. IS-1496]|nr:hypothetical protein [Mycobacterium sp. IS-1496]
MTAADERVCDTDPLGTLPMGVVAGDGTRGTQLQAAGAVETKYVWLHSG